MSNVGLKRIEFRCFGKGIDPKRGFIVSWRVLDNVMDKEVNVDMREGIGTNVRGGKSTSILRTRLWSEKSKKRLFVTRVDGRGRFGGLEMDPDG